MPTALVSCTDLVLLSGFQRKPGGLGDEAVEKNVRNAGRKRIRQENIAASKPRLFKLAYGIIASQCQHSSRIHEPLRHTLAVYALNTLKTHYFCRACQCEQLEQSSTVTLYPASILHFKKKLKLHQTSLQTRRMSILIAIYIYLQVGPRS